MPRCTHSLLDKTPKSPHSTKEGGSGYDLPSELLPPTKLVTRVPVKLGSEAPARGCPQCPRTALASSSPGDSAQSHSSALP